MSSKHYKWQARWTVDVPSQTAEHETGLRVRYFRIIDGVAQYGTTDDDVVLGIATCVDNSKWIAITTLAIRDAVFDQLVEKNGEHNTPQMIVRLAREAVQIWEYWYSKK